MPILLALTFLTAPKTHPLSFLTLMPSALAAHLSTIVRMRDHATRYNSDNTLDTATWVMSNPETGRVCTLVGMVHIGDTEYYQTLSTRLAELATAGSEIHYEKIHPITDKQMEELSGTERAHLNSLRTIIKDNPVAPMLAATLGLSLQVKELVYPAGSRNVDLSDLELMRRMGFEEAKKLFDMKGMDDVTPEFLQKVLKIAFKYPAALNLLSTILPGRKVVKRVIMDDRNTLALRAAFNRLQTGDVTLVWGAAHLPEMRKVLEGKGYRLTQASWRKACAF